MNRSQPNAQLNLIVASAPESYPADTPSLPDALKRRDEAAAAERTQLLAKEMERQRREDDDREAKAQAKRQKDIADAEIERKDKLADIEAARIRKEKEEAVKKAKDEQEEREKAARLAERKRRFQAPLPEIRQYLSPFFTDGYAQPNGFSNRQGATKGPMSLKGLRGAGALNKDRKGMERLMYLATIGNDRDHHGFPMYDGGDYGWQRADKEFLGKAQQLLIEFGDLMIDNQMLAE